MYILTTTVQKNKAKENKPLMSDKRFLKMTEKVANRNNCDNESDQINHANSEDQNDFRCRFFVLVETSGVNL